MSTSAVFSVAGAHRVAAAGRDRGCGPRLRGADVLAPPAAPASTGGRPEPRTRVAAQGAQVVIADIEPGGLAEAVSATLLAPGTVHTNITPSLRTRPAGVQGTLHDVDLSQQDLGDLRWLDPREVGRVTVRAIRSDDAHALTHPEWWPTVAERHAVIEQAFARYPAVPIV